VKLSTKGRYAVMAMVDLACYGNDGPVSLIQISRRQEISLSYLEQLFLNLKKAGLVQAFRGPTGGYSLAKPAAQISVGHILEAAQEPMGTLRCAFMTQGCRSDGQKCATHHLWEKLDRQLKGFLDSIWLEDLIDPPGMPKPLGLSATHHPLLEQHHG
jgi:Rrf2 family iron-sulfur cluster assembly transcriptional regulator